MDGVRRWRHATEAVHRGAHLLLRHRKPGDRGRACAHRAHDRSRRRVRALVVNAAGMGADVLDRMLGFDRLPSPRGAASSSSSTACAAARAHDRAAGAELTGKGVLVSPTVYGNVMLGPTAEDLDDRSDTSTSERGLSSLLEKGRYIMPSLLDEEVTTTYAGLRASTEHKDMSSTSTTTGATSCSAILVDWPHGVDGAGRARRRADAERGEPLAGPACRRCRGCR
ncbi:MAG: FAD-dependent oxidoreductase [Candidatus Nanopelagicales bacterium]